MPIVNAECSSCYGTGVYSGMCEIRGEAVECLLCKGSGCEKIRYKAFKRRKRARGIEYVYRSRGTFIATGVGPEGNKIPYSQWLKKGLK